LRPLLHNKSYNPPRLKISCLMLFLCYNFPLIDDKRSFILTIDYGLWTMDFIMRHFGQLSSMPKKIKEYSK
jgi:hypothetical protein